MKTKRILSLLLCILMMLCTVSITAPASIVYAEGTVVFLDGSKTAAGDGSLASPFNTVKAAASALPNGGTIVVTGPTFTPASGADANKYYFTNPAGTTMTVTSVYDGVDYRGALDGGNLLTGAFISQGSNSPITLGNGAGEVVFENVNIRTMAQYGAINAAGHPLTLGEGVTVYEPTENNVAVNTLRVSTTFQIRPYDISANTTETKTDRVKLTLDGCTAVNAVYLGDRGGLTIPGAEINVNSTVNCLYLGDDTKAATVGGLKIAGDVAVVIGENGSLKKTALQHATLSSTGADSSGRAAFTGDLYFLVNGGTLNTANISAEAKPDEGNTYIFNTCDGVSLSYDFAEGCVVASADGSVSDNCVFASSGASTCFGVIEDGKAKLFPTEEGTYTVSTGMASFYTLTYSTPYGEVPASVTLPELLAASSPVVLPFLESDGVHGFLGWAAENGADVPDYEAGESFTLTGDTTLYAVWNSVPTFTVTFKNEDDSIAGTFVGIEGAEITNFPYAAQKQGFEFVRWETEDGEELTAVPGYSVTLVPKYRPDARVIRFLNGEAAQNGDGLSPARPFNTMSSAVNAVSNGGTIVVMGKTPMTSGSLNKNGDIVFTSVYGGRDYRGELLSDQSVSGAYLIWESSSPYSASASGTGRISFDGVNLVFRTQYSGFNANGHAVSFRDTGIFEPTVNNAACSTFRSATTFSVRAYATTQDGSTVSDTAEHYFELGEGTSLNAYYFGDRINRTTGGYTVDVGGTLTNLYISNDIKKVEQGALTVNGDVKVTVAPGGTVKNITTQSASGKVGLAAFNGDLAVIVENGATLTSIDASAKPASGSTYTVRAANADVTLSHGEESGSFEAAVGESYNCVTVSKDGAAGSVFPALGGKASFTLTETGDYTVTPASRDMYTLTLVNKVLGTPNATYSTVAGSGIGDTVVLPALADTDIAVFLGWSEDENTASPEYAGGESFNITENVTLYAIYEALPTNTVTFENYDGTTAGTFEGVEGAIISSLPTPAFRIGYTFVMWTIDGTNPVKAVPAYDAVATAVYEENANGPVYFLDETAPAPEGDDAGLSPEKPFNNGNSLNGKLTGGGTLVIMSRVAVGTLNIANTEEVLITSVYGGVDYRGAFGPGELSGITGAYLEQPVNSPISFIKSASGKVTFENINLLMRSQYGAFNFAGHPFELGDGMKILEPTANDVTCTSFRNPTSFQIRSYGIETSVMEESQVKTSVVGGDSAVNQYFLGTRGELSIPGRSIIVNGTLNSLVVGSDIKNNTQGQLTIEGDIDVTVSSGARLGAVTVVSASGKSGLASFVGNLCIAVNDGAAMGTVSDAAKPEGNTMIVTSAPGAYLCASKNIGEFEVTLDDPDAYNCATVTGNGSSFDVILRDGAGSFTLSESGDFEVTYGNKNIYKLVLLDETFDHAIAPYYVFAEDTENLTYTLPTFRRTLTHTFAGWASAPDAEEAEYEGGEIYNISASATLYAVWTKIPSFDVTFRTEDETELGVFSAYAGAPIEFPATASIHRYGYYIAGWAQKNSEVFITEVPAENVTVYPVYAPQSGSARTVYLNGMAETNGDGTTPDTPFNTLTAALGAVGAAGGTIVVTGLTSFSNSQSKTGTSDYPKQSGSFNNAGDIVITSVDDYTGIDYRAEFDSVRGDFGEGGYIFYANGVNGGQTVMTGKITYKNVTMLKGASTYLNFDSHPCEIGEGVRVYNGTRSTGIDVGTLQIRGMGESGSIGSLPTGLDITLHALEAGTMEINVGGGGSAEVAGVKLHLTSDLPEDSIRLGANTGTLTVNGDYIITYDGLPKGYSTGNYLDHVSGDVLYICNNDVELTSAPLEAPLSYKTRKVSVKARDGVLSYAGSTDKIHVKTPVSPYFFAELYIDDDVLFDTVELDANYEADLELPKEGSYIVEFTDDPYFSITFDTGCSAVAEREWHAADANFMIRNGVKNVGYLFAGWEYDGVIYAAGDNFTMPGENIVLTAVWEAAPPVTLELDNGAYGTKPENVTNFLYEISSLPVLEDENAYFVGWSETEGDSFGVIHYQHEENRTLYAVWSEGGVYLTKARYSDVDKAYVAEVYFKGGYAESGEFSIDFAKSLKFKSCEGALGAEVTSSVIGSDTVYCRWSAEDSYYRIGDERLLMRLFFTCEKTVSDALLPEDKLFFTETQKFVRDDEEYECLARAVTEKQGYADYATVEGTVSFTAREPGEDAKTPAVLFVRDEAGDIVNAALLESIGSDARTASYSVEIPEGRYVFEFIKDGYVHRRTPVAASAGKTQLSDRGFIAGDVRDETGLGDGKVDLGDFVRVMRGFSADTDPDTRRALDVNEDGTVSVGDLIKVKTMLMTGIALTDFKLYAAGEAAEAAQEIADLLSERAGAEITVSGTAQGSGLILEICSTEYKAYDWELTKDGDVVTLRAGSLEAVLHAAETFADVCLDGSGNANVMGGMKYSRDYRLDKVLVDGNELRFFDIIIPDAADAVASAMAEIVRTGIEKTYGYKLSVKNASEAGDHRILVGDTGLMTYPSLGEDETLIGVLNGDIFVAYEGEFGPEIAAYDTVEQMIGTENAGYDASTGVLTLENGYILRDRDRVGTKFLLMSDTHIESDFLENGRDVYTGWKPDFQSLIRTYEYINENFPDLEFALLCGDQLNTGYSNQPQNLEDERVNYYKTLEYLDLYKNSKTEGDLAEKLRFTKTPTFVDRNVVYTHPELNSRVIAFQGNHDTGVEDFYRQCAFTSGDTRFICYFASYVGLPAPEGSYKSTGKISDEAVDFIEAELKEAAADDSIKHIILNCHWSIVQNDSNFTWPIYDACPENGYNDNRNKLLSLCEQYGCDFYINGHEHNSRYPTGKAGCLTDINIGSTTSRWAVVEIHTRKAVFDIYNTATADGITGEITKEPAFYQRKTVDITPKDVLLRG